MPWQIFSLIVFLLSSTNGRYVWEEIAIEENQQSPQHRIQSVLSEEIEIGKNVKKTCRQDYAQHQAQQVNMFGGFPLHKPNGQFRLDPKVDTFEEF